MQVGSFGSSEQAERLRTQSVTKGYLARVQLCSRAWAGSAVPCTRGQPYRADSAADQTAQHLTAQEQVPAIVAGKD